ncbi:MAG TPA: N-formylglutamate amidohydrolase [Alphaproteobacteria bacterium]|nr:N-formylglutamate amidohydrolase [Alphaproteobacteria bacterium]
MAHDARLSASHLLQPGDPPAVEIVNRQGRAPAVLVCDHASNAVPSRLAKLGLDDATLARHIAWDIGAAMAGRALAKLLDAPLLLPGFSRLVIDLNRDPADPTAICVISDRSIVPGNRDLTGPARAARIAEIFEPYQNAVAQAISDKQRPAVISLHSFTPVISGWGHERQQRPWHVGVLYHHDNGMAPAVLAALRARGDLVVGDNEPYSAKNGHGYTLAAHAEPAGLPNVEIEMRQDLIADPAGAERMAGILAEALKPLLARL